MAGIGPKVGPWWWDFIRQVVIFALGVALILDVAINPAGRLSLVVTGLILIGLVPVDSYLSRSGKNGRNGGTLAVEQMLVPRGGGPLRVRAAAFRHGLFRGAGSGAERHPPVRAPGALRVLAVAPAVVAGEHVAADAERFTAGFQAGAEAPHG